MGTDSPGVGDKDDEEAIAAYYGITVDELRAANRDKLVKNADGKLVLKRGVKLTIPVRDPFRKP